MSAIVDAPVGNELASGDVLAIALTRNSASVSDDVVVDIVSLGAAARKPRVRSAARRVADLEETVLALRRQIIQVQEAERERIARDLHDEAGHALSAAVLRLDLEMMQLAGDPAAIGVLKRVRQQLVECSSVLHNIAFDLRPRILEDLGLHAALRSLASHAMELADLKVTVAISGISWMLNESEELVILRVVQEGLTNVRKHAQAHCVRISLRYAPDGLTLRIADDGIGMHPLAAARCDGAEHAALGIGGLRERVELAGGRFSIRRGRTGGTSITARLPR